MLVSRDVILTYINSHNASLSMAFFGRFFFMDCTEQLQNNISSEKTMNCDGERLTRSSLNIRYIEITGYFNEILNRREMEGELKRVFHPSLSGTLEYYHKKDKKRYTISCLVDKMPDVRFANGKVNFVINLKCLDPYWYGEEITVSIPPYSKTFNNIGDSLTGAIFELSGSAVEPFISNQNSDKITVKTTLNNQTLKITSLSDKSLVEINGINAMKYLTDSTQRSFPLLDIGENTISYGAASGAESLNVKVKYRPRFLGAF